MEFKLNKLENTIDLSDLDHRTQIDGIITKVSLKLAKHREDLIRDRLKQIGAPELNLNARFKSLIREIDANQIERWYYNDGSVEGKLLITFFPPELNQSELGNYTVSSTISYK